ncbi:MAG: winged helix-turn-helix transcriptional regulator [Oligoflexia bacterium]|nr:winged helix-turn-helix transcriptional regulator [Oligoflexia bacterium]
MIADQMVEKSEEASRILKLMSHPQRLMILCLLADGEMTVGQLEEKCKASQSAVSQFLTRMRIEGLLESRREGSFIHYRVSDPKIIKIVKSLNKIFCE